MMCQIFIKFKRGKVYGILHCYIIFIYDKYRVKFDINTLF
jgi:hypothetical protein